jgi:ATP-dependent helicase/nuclease subunit A
MTVAPPADQDVRERLLTDLDSTFFVEAGAGTGKTTAVVSRIVELIAHGRLEIPRLVAITFTEAAAGELRARVREAVQGAASDPLRPADQSERCRLAAGSIEDATIDTIHAFAAYILQTFPIEAGLPPGFEVLEPIEEQLEFHDRFRAWFDQAAANPALSDLLRKALLLGLEPNHIRAAAGAMQEHYDLLHPQMRWAQVVPEAALELAHRLGPRIRDLLPWLNYGTGDARVVDAVRAVQFTASRLIAATAEDEALRALGSLGWRKKIGNVGRQGEWQVVPETGQNALLMIREAFADLDEADNLVVAHRTATLVQLLPEVTRFLLGWAEDRKREGRATFHDLLTWARNLVRDNPEVRRKLQDHVTHIFVDEFQDTDPLQAELVMYLVAPPNEALPGSWLDISPLAGKLFIVGDPKQSIYRFRRADIALYQAIQDQVGHLEKLTSNFRAVPTIIDWINQHFSLRIVHQPGAQPHYSALTSEQPLAGPALWVVGEAMPGANQGQVWQAEADALASVARQAVEDGWIVSEEQAGALVQRPATFHDIALLVPSRTNLTRIQRAFDGAGVPYRLESGELILATQEVRDILSCLRAMDDPSDQVALVAALRSPVYGCSDVDLLRWVEARGRLTYEYFSDGIAEPVGVRSALEDLQSWHQRRHNGSVAALVESFVDQRMLAVAAIAGPRPTDIWRRYRHIIDRARAFASTGRTTLRAFLDWMDDLRDENQLALPGAPEESDDDAVRVLTVHGAKGLEFPIVLMSGWHSRRSFTAPAAIPDWVNGSLEVACGPDRLFQTNGYAGASAAERTLGDAELVRLVYVASTRARDHLVVSLVRKDDTKEAGQMAATLGAFGEVRRLEVREWPPRRTGAAEPVGELTPSTQRDSAAGAADQVLRAEQDWMTARAAALRTLAGMRSVTATGLAHLAAGPELESPVEVAALRRGRGGTSLGRAVHAVLQVIDLVSLAKLDDLSRAQAAAEGIERRWEDVARLVRSAAESGVVRRAASGRFWREVPVAVMIEGSVLEGYVDLIYELDGGLGIVDYKTDSVTAAEADRRMQAYRVQGEAYRLAVEQATGQEVKDVTFVFASLAGREVAVPAQEQLREQLLTGLRG